LKFGNKLDQHAAMSAGFGQKNLINFGPLKVIGADVGLP